MAKQQKGKTADVSTIALTRLHDAVLEVPIIGISPLIPHQWSEKSKRLMPGHPEAGDIKKTKEKRDPKAEAEACLYRLNGKLAFPATGFKAAMVGACRFFEKPTMKEGKLLFFVEGQGPEQLTLIDSDEKEKELREDTPRNANGNCDLRYRYALPKWSAVLRIRYVPERITQESIVALVDAAGRGGIGDWRPSAPKSDTGTFGTFRVDEAKEVKNVV